MENFQIFVKPVGASCNLSCTYCYYSGKPEGLGRSEMRMPDELLENYIIQHIAASSDRDIFFSWHGGEPALAGLDFFRRVVFLQQKHLPVKRRIRNGIQTNGTLLNDEWCRFLKKEHFVVGISLDGPEEYHSHRLRKDGKSSFLQVIRGLDLLIKYRITFEILCVVHAGNVSHPLEVYRFFREIGAFFITFLPLVERKNGEITARSVPAKAFGTFLCTIFEEWKENDIGRIKIQIVEEALRTYLNEEHILCIFRKTCGRVPVLEANGDFYACDHYVNPEHLIGNILDQPVRSLLENPRQVAFGEEKYHTLPDYCLNCEVLELCNGACPKDRFLSAPDGTGRLNYLCEGYKLFFNHIKPFAQLVAKMNG